MPALGVGQPAFDLVRDFEKAPRRFGEAWKFVKKLKQRHAELVEQSCDTLIADRGLDDTKLIELLWDDCGIKPVIGIRNLWKDGEETKLLDGQNNVVYDYQGNVYCYCMMTG